MATRRPALSRCTALLALCVLSLLVPSALAAENGSAADALWGPGLFRASPSEIAAAVAATGYTGTDPVLVLFEGGRFAFAADGTMTRTTFLAFKILKQDAVRAWGSLSIGWSPWHEDRPVVRARVVNEDGREYALDPASLIESAVGDAGDATYSDRRRLEGPYPQVRTGSVVEVEISTVTRPVMEGAGIAARWWYGGDDLVVASRLEVVTPEGMPLAVRALGTAVPSPVVRTEGGRTVREYRALLVPAAADDASLRPRDAPPAPVLYFSTAPAWERLATGYAALVDRAIAAKPVTLPREAVVPGDAAATALNLVRWINDRVRYVGLELGENSIVPYAPGDTLARGHGDCKDKATLLASLLRQAGWDASVALLWNGSDADIPPDLPGVNFFNHAIVRVETGAGLWIDPTVEWGRDVSLPSWDRERWALVARRSGGALVATPGWDQAANVNTVTYEYGLADKGPGGLTETTVYGGGYDLYFRQQHAFADPREEKADLEKYAKDTYGDVTVQGVGWSDPKDFSTPFTRTLNLAKCYRAYTDTDEARAHLDLGEPLTWLPDLMLSKETSRRKEPLRLPYPFVLHAVYRIRPPSGFVARAALETSERMLGTVRLRTSSTIEPDGTVVVRCDLETTKVTLTPEELERTRAAVAGYREKLETLTVSFDHRAGVLLAEGRYREAFDLHRALIAASPGVAVHEIRLSRALLAAGLGDEAAATARQAAALAPADTDVLDNLAWVLQFDTIGRRFGRGWDRAGAIAAYEKLLALDPSEDYARADFAIMLEHDADGVRYADPAGVARALEQYRLIKVPLKDLDMEENPVLALMHLGRFADMETAAAALSDPARREVNLLVARAAGRGTATALAGVNRQASREDQRRYMGEAGSLLAGIHRYAEAAELYRQAARGSSEAANLEYQADFLSRLKSAPAPDPATTDPVEMVKAWFEIMSRGVDGAAAEAARLLAPDLQRLQRTSNTDEASEEELRALFAGMARQGVSHRFVIDLLFSVSTFRLSGDARSGWHVTMVSDLTGDANTLGFVIENVGTRPLITALSSTPASYVTRARALARSGDLKAAGQWLDWLRDDLAAAGGDTAAVLKAAWGRSSRPDAASVDRALVLLAAAFPESAADVRAVDALLGVTDGTVRTAALIARAIGADSLEDAPLQAESARMRYDADRDDTGRRDDYLAHLMRAAEFERFDAEIAVLLKADPDDRDLKRAVLQSLIDRRDPAGIERFLREEGWQPSAAEYNSIAWVGLFGDAVSDQALEYARKAVNLTKSGNRASLHTLAALYAATGRYEDARSLMEKCLELGIDGEPRDYDWYVFGMIAEGYGFPAAARAAYLKVEPPVYPERLSTWELARKRLDGLPK